jgi:sulfide:quinone oxidoreductase
MARILILGGGFAAISAAETLASAVGPDHQIMLVSKSADFTFYPAIVPMVFGDFKPEEIRFDLRPKLSERRIQFIQGDVRAVDIKSRTVNVAGDAADRVIGFDYVVIAVGRGLATKTVPGLFEHAHHLLGVDAALKFREAISEFESGAIVVGLCPEASLPVPVCESALALGEQFEDEIERGDVSLTVVVPTTLDKAFEGAALFRDIEAEFDRKGIRLVSEFAVTRVEKDNVVSALGASLHHDLLMLIPPFSGQPCLRDVDGVTDASGFAMVNEFMQVKGSSGIYAAGEIVSMPGPKLGYIAMRQGKIAAQNLLAELNGATPSVEYRHKPAWVIGEKYTNPIFFHYGFWDETLSDFDEDALFGMARVIRNRYGPIDISEARIDFEPVDAAVQ